MDINNTSFLEWAIINSAVWVVATPEMKTKYSEIPQEYRDFTEAYVERVAEYASEEDKTLGECKHIGMIMGDPDTYGACKNTMVWLRDILLSFDDNHIAIATANEMSKKYDLPVTAA